ncbi:MAG TPA: hypothetical protein VGO66_10450 [Solirubrobacterales bacterium]|jgi:hypothetical protein|nr:hypothetical protein [Solirubrobacterales bacterium]
MNTREIEMALVTADPVDREWLDGLDLDAMEPELLADLDGEQPAPPQPGTKAPRRPRPQRLALALGAATLAAAVAVLVVLPGGGSDRTSRAYGAELVRFAESTPLLLLEGPDWRVQNVFQQGNGEGSMEFVTGKPVPYESIQVTGNDETGQRQSGMFPAPVRQRKVDLAWRPGALESSISTARGMPHPHGQRWTKAPVLKTTADVNTRAEFFVNQGGPGNRQMTAFWSEDGYVLELRAAVPDLAAFEERLDWLNRVDSQTWLDAMPPKVVKAADHDAAVREMLKGIPVPGSFKASRVPDEGLTTNRYQLGAAVTGTVTCLWFRQWGEARRSGDRAAEAKAENAMATAKDWPILHEMEKDGAYPNLIWQLAAAMPSGEWPPRGWRLLPHAEGLGCARHGIPVLPWKQRLQRER